MASIVLVGNPNAGKSTLFNAMTGSHQRVMNAPGTTVELQLGVWRTGAGPVDVVDLPGTYSLVARSPDEQVVADALAGGPLARERVVTLAVVVLDATAIARSLYLLAQVAQTGHALVVAVTMLDVARAHGTVHDLTRLAEVLGVPVLGLDPRSRDGLDGLEALVSTPVTARVRGVPPVVLASDSTADQLAVTEGIFDWVEQVMSSLAPAPAPRRTRTDVVDRALLSPWLGIPVFFATMWALFQLATTVAAPVIGLVDRGLNGPVAALAHSALRGWSGPWLEGLVVDGVLAGFGTVFTFVPLMGVMYTALALLEDSGYMARAAFLADRAMRTLGLDGRAMLPLLIGFGCNVPAIAATRTLPNARQRLLTGLLVPWTSCAARLTVYILLASIFFPEHAGTAIFAMYVLSVVLVVGGGLVLRRTAFTDVRREPLVLVLPAYQRPRLRPIAMSVVARVLAFVTKAGKIIVATLVVVWVLMSVPAGAGGTFGDVPVEDSLYGKAAVATAPVLAPAGLGDWHVTAALATGFVAKEVVVGALAQSYAVAEPVDPAKPDEVSGTTSGTTSGTSSLGGPMRATFERTSGGHPSAAALALMVFVLGYTPCLATVAEQWRRFGGRWTGGAIAVQLVVAWVLAVVVFQVGRLL